LKKAYATLPYFTLPSECSAGVVSAWPNVQPRWCGLLNIIFCSKEARISAQVVMLVDISISCSKKILGLKFEMSVLISSWVQ